MGAYKPFNSQTNLSFGDLRTEFKEASTGEIKASQLRRNTTKTAKNPIVPDCKENRQSGLDGKGISTQNNLKISSFVNAAKSYTVTSSSNAVNLNIASLGWNTNFDKNIRKVLNMNATYGSNDPFKPAVSSYEDCYNLTIKLSGKIYGAAGRGATLAGSGADINSTSTVGGKGGDAFIFGPNSSNNVNLEIKNGAILYAGGGGGEQGANGATGTTGTCYQSTTVGSCDNCGTCPSGWASGSCSKGSCCKKKKKCNGRGWPFKHCWRSCSSHERSKSCNNSYAQPGGAGGAGGAGGKGRGYDNRTGPVAGAGGAGGSPSNGCGSGAGKSGLTGADGGGYGSKGKYSTRGNNSSGGGAGGRGVVGNIKISGYTSNIRGTYPS